MKISQGNIIKHMRREFLSTGRFTSFPRFFTVSSWRQVHGHLRGCSWWHSARLLAVSCHLGWSRFHETKFAWDSNGFNGQPVKECNVGKGVVNPPLNNWGKWINFFNRLWRDSLCAIDSLWLNVLGTMGWILYWQMCCWLASCWLLAAFAFFFLFPFSFQMVSKGTYR